MHPAALVLSRATTGLQLFARTPGAWHTVRLVAWDLASCGVVPTSAFTTSWFQYARAPGVPTIVSGPSLASSSPFAAFGKGRSHYL